MGTGMREVEWRKMGRFSCRWVACRIWSRYRYWWITRCRSRMKCCLESCLKSLIINGPSTSRTLSSSASTRLIDLKYLSRKLIVSRCYGGTKTYTRSFTSNSRNFSRAIINVVHQNNTSQRSMKLEHSYTKWRISIKMLSEFIWITDIQWRRPA